MAERYPAAVRVGVKIQALRERHGLSGRALAKRAQMPHNNLLKIERGESSPPIETYARIARALGVPLHRLFVEGSAAAHDDELMRWVAAMGHEYHDLVSAHFNLGKKLEEFEDKLSQPVVDLLRTKERYSGGEDRCFAPLRFVLSG